MTLPDFTPNLIFANFCHCKHLQTMFLVRLLFASSSKRFIWPRHIRSLFGSSMVASPARSSHNSSQCLFHRHSLLQCHKALPPLHHVTTTSHLHTSALLTEDDVSKTEVPDEQKTSSGDCKPNADNSKTSSPPAPRFLLSDRCRTRLQTVLDPDEILRIGVRGGGCSGFEYEFSVEKASTIKPNEDIVFEGKVVVDSESIEYMSGAQLDYEDELIRSGFRVVNNPLAEKGCSCGSSFSLKF